MTQGEVKKRKDAEDQAANAWKESEIALDLARNIEDQLKEEIALYEDELQRLQDTGTKQSEKDIQQLQLFSKKAAEKVDLTEADTRKLIDQHLQATGWEADTAEIRFSKGVRPEKGKNKAMCDNGVVS